MALSGVSRQTFTNNEAHDLVIEWTATQNKAENYSTVTAKLFIQGNKYYSTIESGSVQKYVSITINGVKSRVEQHRIDITGTNRMQLITHSARVNHDSNGNASFTIRGAVDVAIWWHGRQENTYNMSDKRFTLDTIPRGSTLSLNSSSVNYGDRLRFKINAADSSFRHIVKLNVTGFSGTIMSNETAGDKSYETRREWMSSLSNSTRTNGTLQLDTYSGNSRIDTKSYNIEFRIPNDVSPTFSNLGHSEYNGTVSSVLGSSSGTYIQGLSRIKFNISATGGYSSSIRSTSIYVGGNSINGDILDLSQYKGLVGSVSYEVKAIDSRSREISSKGTLNIAAYHPPRIQSFQAYRNSSGGIDVKRSGSISEIRVGGYDKNSMTSRLYLKASSSSYWDEQGSSSSFSNTTIYRAEKGRSYQVKTSITDKFTTVESIVTVSTERALLNLHKEQGIGIGKMHEKGILDVDGDVYMAGRLFCETATFTEGVMPVPLGGGADFNNCLKSLRYSIEASAASSARNIPYKMSGVLDVSYIRDGVIIQTFTTNEPNMKMFMRASNAGRWNKWQMIAGTIVKNLPSVTSAYSPFAINENENTPQAYRTGGMVTLVGAYKANKDIGAYDNVKVAQLPQMMIPKHGIIARQQASLRNTIMVEVTESGGVMLNRFLGETVDKKTIKAGDWINIGCTFPASTELVDSYD